MEIQRFENDSRGSFFVEKDGEKLAEMTYSKAGADKISRFPDRQGASDSPRNH